MKLLIQLVFLWVVWLASPQRWQRLLAVLFSAVAVGLVIISSWGVQLTLWGLTVWLSPDNGEAVDAIVVLGRGEAFRDLRTGTAQELWQAQRAPRIFASGMMDARSIIHDLRELNVPVQALSGEECSRSTQENALFTAALIEPRGAQHILLVTDKAHMLRSTLIFRKNGFQVTPHPIPLPLQYSLLEKQHCLFREYVALVRYILIKEWAKPLPNRFTAVSIEVTDRIRDWNCRVQGAV